MATEYTDVLYKLLEVDYITYIAYVMPCYWHIALLKMLRRMGGKRQVCRTTT